MALDTNLLRVSTTRGAIAEIAGERYEEQFKGVTEGNESIIGFWRQTTVGYCACITHLGGRDLRQRCTILLNKNGDLRIT